jgi:hypothetical protein
LLCSALIAACLSIGYHLGAQSAQKSTPSESEPPEGIEVQEAEVNSEDEDEEMADGDLSAVRPGFMEQCKLVSSSYVSSVLRVNIVLPLGGPCGANRLENDSRENICAVSGLKIILQFCVVFTGLHRCGSVCPFFS